jgi:hypothetical protein
LKSSFLALVLILSTLVDVPTQPVVAAESTEAANARPPVHDGPTASDAIGGRRQNAAAASQAKSVEHRKLHLRSRDCDDKPTPAFFRVVELGGQE